MNYESRITKNVVYPQPGHRVPGKRSILQMLQAFNLHPKIKIPKSGCFSARKRSDGPRRSIIVYCPSYICTTPISNGYSRGETLVVHHASCCSLPGERIFDHHHDIFLERLLVCLRSAVSAVSLSIFQGTISDQTCRLPTNHFGHWRLCCVRGNS